MTDTAQTGEKPVVVWFRDDLRLADNPALAAAASLGRPIVALYCLDEGGARRPVGGATRWWLHQSLASLSASLAEHRVRLVLRRGRPEEIVPEVVRDSGATAIHWNRRYGLPERTLDGALKVALEQQGVEVASHNGHLLLEPWTVRTKSGDWFKVFTPFWKSAREQLFAIRQPLPVPTIRGADVPLRSDPLSSFGLEPTRPDWAGGLRQTWTPGEATARARLADFLEDSLARYAADRNSPSADATSNLSPHLRFGEISVVTVWHAAQHHAAANGISETALAKFLAELGWREFSYNLLFHFPDLQNRNFQPRFDGFPWQKPDEEALEAWRRGLTGYPIVDAGMRQLWQTGIMHNRVRMIAASFLVKHLLVHWKTGEEWFWDTLVDADPANNAASWQWVAGSGADASPYFRVFNPVAQGEKFDQAGDYVRNFVPELGKLPLTIVHKPWTASSEILRNFGVTLARNYPEPIVDHAAARERALAAFDRLKSHAA